MMRLSLLGLLATGCVPHLYTSGDGGDVVAWTLPDNQWSPTDVEGPPTDLVAEGFDVGEVVPDLRLPDQDGQTVSLWQFYGEVVVLDISTIWCGPCQELAATTEEVWTDYQPQGFMYVTVIQQDLEGEPPGADDIDLWVDSFGITAPVLADATEPAATAEAILGGQFPAVMVIGRDMRVIERVNPPDDPTLRLAIEAAL